MLADCDGGRGGSSLDAVFATTVFVGNNDPVIVCDESGNALYSMGYDCDGNLRTYDV